MKSDLEAEFIKACEDYSDDLFRFCYFKISDREMAKDFVQETYLRTWNYMIRGNKVHNIRALFYKILGNLIVDQYRKKKTVSLENLTEFGFEPGFSDLANLENKIDGEKAIKILSQLPENYKEVIFMRYVQDMSLREISEITGESENIIAVKVHRGLKKIKKIFES